MPQRILVTGGAGFVGSHLIDRLLADGHAVICMDDLTTGSWDNLLHVARHPRLKMQHHDITQPFDVDVDAIYNLACPASPPQYQRDPVRTTRICVLGALNVLDLAVRRACPVLQASTSEVYGDPSVHPQSEDYNGDVNPIGPRACYDEGKRCAETLFFDYHRQYGVDVKVARIFNTYGPRMQLDDGRVVSNFITQALRGQPITLYGDGSQTRSLCYVDDLVDGLVRLMKTDGRVDRPVNLGNPQEVTVRRLAQHVMQSTGRTVPLIRLPLPQDDPRRRRPDIGRARRLLAWMPRVGLEEGLRLTTADFERRLIMTSMSRVG
jgi:UDP-glucuronate decarboxylase